MPLQAPEVLESMRLRLRIVQPGDLPDLMAMNGDDEVTRFLPYASWRSPQDGQAWLERMSKAMAEGSALQFVLIDKSDERAIGSALLFRYDEASARAELGYVLARARWGRGLMQEALRTLLKFGFETLGLRKIEAEVNPANRASARALAALGFRCEGLLRQRWTGKGRSYDVAAYGLLADELRATPVANFADMAEPAIEYRPAQAGDAACLAMLSTQVFLHTYAVAGIGPDLAHEAATVHAAPAFERLLADPQTQVIVAAAAGLLVGFVELALQRPCPVVGGGQAEIVRLYIHPNFQRRGLGRALCARAEALARQHAAHAIWLTAWTGNQRALAYYPAVGYTDIGRSDYVMAQQSYENRVFSKPL